METSTQEEVLDIEKESKLDVCRYGLSLDRQYGAVKVYVRHFDSGVSVELEEMLNRYTLILRIKKDKSIIADRYRCETQEQLDFLIRFGGVHILFGN
jgi:hypothetical protein